MAKEEAQLDEAQIIQAFIEDELVCEGCQKVDVCVVLHLLTQQHMGVSEFVSDLEKKYKVKVNLRTSIIECKHRREDLMVL